MKPNRLERRGWFAAVSALVAAVIAKPHEVHATSGGGVDGNFVLGSNFGNSPNFSNALSVLSPGSGLTDPLVFDVDATAGGAIANINGIYGHAKGVGSGVVGINGPGTGLRAFELTNCGVYAYGTAAANGVRGSSDTGNGVLGTCSDGPGVYGVSTNNSGTIGYGLHGIGVFGQTDSASSYGVFGHNTAGGAGVVGQSTGYAGVFAGAVYVAGSLTVTGAKSAAVPHPDGSLRRLYCVESPESWFEDFGKGQLECGQADITIEPDFAAVVDLADYHVFLTAYDGDHLLHVANQTPEGFTVQAKDTTASGRFSWRVVAKRKDIRASRLEHVDSALMTPMAPVTMPKLSWGDGVTASAAVSSEKGPGPSSPPTPLQRSR
jgi:hypothetical protein